jgi:hypothetical protein
MNPVIRRFQGAAPVDVSALAVALGINVWESEFLPDGVSGKLFRDPENGGSEGFSIIVRESDAYPRKRFTVAHEIAHFTLHRSKVGNSLVDDAWYRSNLSTTEEAEANRWAADLLMPKGLIAEYVERLGPNPAALASVFEVSEAAMRIRLGLQR